MHWADVILVATPIRWGAPGSLYSKMVERMNCIQNQETLHQRHLLKNKVSAFIVTGGQDNVQAVVVMDMIGYSADAQLDMLLEGPAQWTDYLNQFAAAATTYEPTIGVTISNNTCCSDHMPYINAGRRTVLVSEKDWNIYPHYHRSTDLRVNTGIYAQAMGSAILRTNVAVLAGLVGASDRIFADSFEALGQ